MPLAVLFQRFAISADDFWTALRTGEKPVPGREFRERDC
jgi:hypothetical protein